VFAHGSVAPALALQHAQQLLYEQGAPAVLVTAVDSYLLPETLALLHRSGVRSCRLPPLTVRSPVSPEFVKIR